MQAKAGGVRTTDEEGGWRHLCLSTYMPSPHLPAGHGSQCRDYTGEETDGMNETLCPMDFRTVSATAAHPATQQRIRRSRFWWLMPCGSVCG